MSVIESRFPPRTTANRTAAQSAPIASEKSSSKNRAALVAPALDAWLVGGLGILAWLLLAEPFGTPSVMEVPEIGGAFLWLLLAVTGTHFGISYHLAYGQGRSEIRRRSPQLLGAPILLVAISVTVVVAALAGYGGLADSAVRVLLVTVFTLTGWHYLKQVYGVGRLFASINGLSIGQRETKVLRYGLYPLWFLNASVVWVRGPIPTSHGFDSGFGVLPTGIETVLLAVAVFSAVIVGGTFVVLSRQWARVPPAAMWMPYLAGYLWFVWRPGHISAVLVLGALHSLQYLVCAHRAEVAWAEERAETRPIVWWCSVFGGALSAGMLLSYWMPMWLGDRFSSYGLGTMMAALLFACFNLHHYAVDSAIWRSRDGHSRRIVTSATSR